jgi:L-lactate dehydrogenase complex protein LldG
MSTSGRVEFIENIRKALDRNDSFQRSLDDVIQKEPDTDDLRLLETIAGRDTTAGLALLDQLMEAGKRVNVSVLTVIDAAAAGAAIVEIAAEKSAEWGDRKVVVAWDHPLIKRIALSTCLAPLGIPVYFPDVDPVAADGQATFRRHAEEAFIGVTSADYCIARTATLTMKSRPGQPRCTSLLPSIHIAVIRLDQVLTTLKELYTLLKWNPAEQAEGITRCMTFITGPSKTADIEATLVHGAHGPRELFIIVLSG